MSVKLGSVHIKVSVTTLFRDDKLMGAVERAEMKALRWQGGYVRKAAQNRLTKGKESSAPGQSPTDQTGKFKKSILFSYDAANHSVVIGPRIINIKRGLIPAALEHGGTTMIDSTRAVYTNGKRKFVKDGGKRRVKIEARPTMGPALDSSLSHLSDIWAKSVRSR